MITVFRPQRERFKAFVTRSSLEIAAWNYVLDRTRRTPSIALIILLPSACRARRLDEAL